MLRTGMIETQTRRIHLHGVQGVAVKLFISFIYIGHVQLTHLQERVDTVVQIVSLAVEYRFPELVKQCADHCQCMLSADTVG
eukprot:370783-Alexandrium_andersonii.AAC.1